MIKRLLAIGLSLSLACPVWCAPAPQSTEAAGAGHRSSTSPLAWSFNNVSGTKLYCGFVATNLTSDPALTMNTPTYNTVPMNLAGSQIGWDTNHSKTALYYLDTPA